MATTAASNETEMQGAGTAGPVLVLSLRRKTRGRYRLDRPRMTIGRASDSDILLNASTGVSRHHAHILIVEDEVVVEDLGSRNGTFVNGKLTTRRTLKPGDRIAIGHYRLYFQHERSRARSRSRERPPESQLTRLMRAWDRAAVTTDIAGCPLCASSDLIPETPITSETGEHQRIDEDCYEWFNDPIVALAGGDPDTAEPGVDNYPPPEMIEGGDDDEEPLDEDELMARVERLVGLAPGAEPQRPQAATDEAVTADGDEDGEGDGKHGARDRIQSKKPSKRRQSGRRRKNKRRGRSR